MRLKQNETNQELQVRLADLVNMWMCVCMRDDGGGQGQAQFGAAAGNASTSSEDVRQGEETDDKSGSRNFSVIAH